MIDEPQPLRGIARPELALGRLMMSPRHAQPRAYDAGFAGNRLPNVDQTGRRIDRRERMRPF
jgi:hypothetical protein